MLPDCTRNQEGLSLLLACKENPLDLAPRLILTDWLEEQGEEEVARCLRESLADGGDLVPLPTSVQARWHPLNGCEHGWLCLRPEADTLLQKLDHLTNCEWFGSLTLRNLNVPGVIEPLMGHPAFQQLVRLEIDGNWPHRARQAASIKFPWPHLAILVLEAFQFENEEIIALTKDPALIQLQALHLNGSFSGIPGVEAILNAPWIRQLKQLSISSCPEHVREPLSAMLQDERLSGIEHLNLSGCWLRRIVPNSMPRSEIRSLNLSRNGLTKEILKELVVQSDWRSLTSLNLTGNELDEASVGILVQSTMLDHLKTLVLDNCASRMLAMSQLLASPKLQELEELELTGNQMLDADHLRGIESANLPKLRSLKLMRCELSEPSIKNIVQAPFMQTLEKLDLYQNRMGPQGVDTLLSGPHWNIKNLNLGQNFIGNAGVRQLALSPKLQTVEHLDLSDNGIGLTGIGELTESRYVSNLRTISFRNNLFEDGCLQALARCPNFSKLEMLGLGEVRMTDVGLQAILQAAWIDQLSILILWGNQLSQQGYQLLADSPQLQNLTDLYVNGWKMTEESKAAVKNAPQFRFTIIHW